MQLLDVNLGRAIPDPSEKAATYILDGHPCYDALRVKSLPSGAQKTIRGHTLPASRSQCPHLAVIVPDGCSFEILDESVIVFCDEHGREYIRTRPATGWWGGNADGPSINSGGVGRIHIVEDDQINVEGREARTIRLVPVAADWAAWDGSRFYLDPTATLTADAATEDAMIFTANTTNNYGSYPYQAAGLASDSGATWKELIQFTDPANDIPAGAITGFAYYAYPFPISGWSVSPSTITFSALSNTEAGVVMGTTSGSAQAGSCCYAYRAYDATTPTAWGGGAGSPDVEAGTASGTYNESTAAYQSASWSTQWAEDMRDGVLTAATVLAEGSGAVGAMYFMRGRESGSNEPYWEIDYNDAPVGGIANRWLVMR